MSTLSLLSRGNAQVVRTSQEKLVVRYEPEDYFNWKSHQDFDIRRFLSGRCASIHYWAVPTHKTYSTRKGALVLYSEDLALPAWHESQDRRVKRRQRYKRKSYQTELSTLQDLTGAILSYGRKQTDQTEPYWQPYLHFLNKEDVQCRRQIRPGYSPKRYLTRLFQTWDPNTVYKLQQAGILRDSVQLQKLAASVDSGGRHPDLSSTPLKYHRLPVFTCLPYWSNTDVFTCPGNCTPVEEEAENEELAYDKEILEIYGKNSNLPSTAALRKSSPEARESNVTHSSWKVKEQSNSHMGEAQQNQPSGDDAIMTDRHEKRPAPVDVSFLMENSAVHYGKPHITFYGGPFAGQRKHSHSKPHKDYLEHLPEGGFLPPISQPPSTEALKDPITKVQESLKLPRIIIEEPTKIPQRKRRRHATDPPKELLVIPLLVCFENQKVNQEEQTGMEEITKNGIYNPINNEEPEGGKSKSKEDLKEEQIDPPHTSDVPISVEESRFKTLQMDIDWNLDPNTGGDLPAPEVPPLGSLPPINGKKGPGNQSSKANLKAANATSSASAITPKGLPTGIIRGSLPEELKECCNGSSVGSLIMGPDGEIVCLSLMGATQDANIPIRFDFIPEEEEDCLPVESAGQEEQWSGSRRDSEKEQDSYSPCSLRDSSGSPERVSTPLYRKGKKGKRKNPKRESSLQGEGTEVSVQEVEQHRFSEKTQKGHKGDVSSGRKKDKLSKRTEEESDRRGEDIEERNSRTRSPQQESERYSAENGPENGDEASRSSIDNLQDQYTEEGTSDQNMQPSQPYIQPPKSPYSQPQDLTSFNKTPQIQAEASSRSTSDKEQLDSDILGIEQGTSSDTYTDELNNQRHSVLTKDDHKSSQEKETERGEQQTEIKHGAEQRTKKEGRHTLPDATNISPRLMEAISHRESASSEPNTVSAESDPAAPSAGQDPNYRETSGQVIKGSGRPPKLTPRTSEVTTAQNPKSSDKNGNNPEISKDVEKESSERKENVPVPPPQTEVKQDNSRTDEKPQLTEEELALLQEITSAVAKDTTKLKGKKKAKNEKAQKPEKSQGSTAKKVNQKEGAEQGKAVFVVGKPKNKKGESNNSYQRKPSIQVMVENTIHEIQETPEEIQEEEDNEKETSEDSYVVIEYHERTPTPTQSKDIDPESESTNDYNQISGQTDDNQVTATLEVTSQSNEDDYSHSETSELTSSSLRQRRSSRAREISEKAERRRLEVERKRREREEQLRLEKEQQERMDKMKEELEQEQLRRAEEIRLGKKQEEEERQRQEQMRACKLQLEQQALERARQQQEEHRRKLHEIQRRKQQEEIERIEMERQRQREEEHLKMEERLRLLEMAAEEKEEYQRKKREREEQARQEAEERKRKAEEDAKAMMEEAQRQAHLLAKQAAALEQQLQFNRGLLQESVGLDQTQGFSRPWVFSYFELLELLGLPLPVEGE